MNVTLFKPHLGQRKIIDGFADSEHKFGVVATSRQWGKSLLGQNLLVYWALKHKGSKCAWVSPIYNQAKKVFNELHKATYEIISSSNKADLTITFINGSTIQFLGAERYDSIRGFSFNYLVIDEAAFIKENAVNEAIFPTLTAIGKKCLIISTPKSKNWFYKYYNLGIGESKDYISFKGLSVDNPYVDQSFIEQQRLSLPAEIFRQEYEAEFSESTNDVFTGVNAVCNLDVWEAPNRRNRCYFGIDTGLTHDYSVLTILNEAGKVVHITRVNNLSYEEIGNRFLNEIRKWNVVGGYVETNGVGAAMFEIIRNGFRKTQPFVTTNDSKGKGIRNLIYKIQQADLELPSESLFPQLKQELEAYTYKTSANGTLTFNAPNGLFDDCVMSLMLANEAREKLALAKGKIHIGGKSLSR